MIFTFDKFRSRTKYKSSGYRRYRLPYFGSQGFTLIELMVTVGIFVFMTALIMAKYNNFYSGTIFKNMAYDIAITIRQAQSYGISVKIDPVGVNVTDAFNKAYGVNFLILEPDQFSLYSYKRTPLGSYDRNSLEKKYILKYTAIVDKMYVKSGNNPFAEANVLDIIFVRPNPEAIIYAKVGSITTVYEYAKITLKMGNNTRSIEVNSAGQVSILDP